MGAFGVTSGIGLKEFCDSFRAKQDDYNAIMAEAIADRLAEAFAECLHKRVREEWGYGRDESLSIDDLMRSIESIRRLRAIRRARTPQKGTLWRLPDVQRTPEC